MKEFKSLTLTNFSNTKKDKPGERHFFNRAPNWKKGYSWYLSEMPLTYDDEVLIIDVVPIILSLSILRKNRQIDNVGFEIYEFDII